MLCYFALGRADPPSAVGCVEQQQSSGKATLLRVPAETLAAAWRRKSAAGAWMGQPRRALTRGTGGTEAMAVVGAEILTALTRPALPTVRWRRGSRPRRLLWTRPRSHTASTVGGRGRCCPVCLVSRRGPRSCWHVEDVSVVAAVGAGEEGRRMRRLEIPSS